MTRDEKYAYSKYWLNYPKNKYIGTDSGVYLLCLIEAMTISNNDIKQRIDNTNQDDKDLYDYIVALLDDLSP